MWTKRKGVRKELAKMSEKELAQATQKDFWN